MALSRHPWSTRTPSAFIFHSPPRAGPGWGTIGGVTVVRCSGSVSRRDGPSRGRDIGELQAVRWRIGPRLNFLGAAIFGIIGTVYYVKTIRAERRESLEEMKEELRLRAR